MPGKFKVVYVTEKEEEGCEHGFVNLALVKKYVDGDFTVMMCGPSAMYAFQDKELAPLGLPLKRVKKEANCVESARRRARGVRPSPCISASIRSK